MASLGSITWSGASGEALEFTIYEWGKQFKAVGAVYVISHRTPKLSDGGRHEPIYIGETGDLSERFDDHHKASCISRHGPNRICIHRDGNAKSRRHKEADLIQKWSPPCND